LARRYSLISLSDFLRWRRGEVAALPPRPLVITLDDGHASNVQLLEVFRRHAVSATIFLCSDIVGTRRRFWWQAVGGEAERQRLKRMPDEQRLEVLREIGYQEEADYEPRAALSADEVAAMREAVDFQAHTRLHPVLPMCTAARSRDEIAGCRKVLVERFGIATRALAYPNGDYSERDVALTREAGFECGLTIDSGYNDWHSDLFRLKRILVPDDASLDELAVKASGLWGGLMRLARRKAPYGRQRAREE
jgi:peptidoglycan/xylan/chitin deacetylase (PgdA/CDA1 family)